MNALYNARASGLPAGATVGEACRAVLAARRASGRSTHPFFWAAFTASGE
jgi:CHAT domain-containing protein